MVSSTDFAPALEHALQQGLSHLNDGGHARSGLLLRKRNPWPYSAGRNFLV
jgi:hypothetical protein